MVRTLVLAIALLCAAAATPALAHPHVWVTIRSQILYAPDGTVTGVRHAWTFDDMFSAFATQGTAQQTKGQFPREELASLGPPQVVRRGPAGGLLPFGDEHVEVLATPGHTAGCLSFRWRDRVFCGGLLAVDACPFQPRPADPRALWDSVVQCIFTLPDETLLFAGHARQGRAASTVFEQRRWHPWFGAASRDEFLARAAALAEARAMEVH